MSHQFRTTVARFGVFDINLRSGELSKHGVRVRLPGQAFKILALLLEEPGEIVTRERIRNALWPADTFVDFEHSLNSAIKKLRVALNDSADNPLYIETIPRIGYRFVAPVSIAAAAGATPVPESASAMTDLSVGLPVSHDAPPVAPESNVSDSPVASPSIGRHPSPAKARGIRSSVLLQAAGLAALLLLTFLIVRSRPPARIPFETTITSRVTNDGNAIKAAISPDGRYIAHTRLLGGRESLSVRRATMLHDTEVVAPTMVHYLGITFSPDGDFIYYVTHSSETTPTRLFRVPVMGGASEELKQDLASSVTFSPDGKRYAFIRETNTESALMIADTATGVERKLASRRLPEVIDYPAWSPDGGTVACTDFSVVLATSTGSEARLVAFDVQNGRAQPVSNQTWGFIKQLAWVEDGKGLVMTARDTDSSVFHVWHVPYGGGPARKLTDGLDYQVGVSITSDARKIVTVQQTSLAGICRLRAPESSDLDVVVSGSNGSSTALWLPDGRLVFERDLNGKTNLWVVSADGSNQKQLTFEGNNYLPAISADAHVFEFLSDRSGKPAVWTMNLDGSGPRMLREAFGETAGQLSPDGDWIVFSTIRGSRWKTLWTLPTKGGTGVELDKGLWLRPTVSPDGRWIAGFYADGELSTNREPNSIAVISPHGGPIRKVMSLGTSVSTAAGLRWTRDGRYISYVNRSSDGDNVWMVALVGGTPRQVTQLHGETLFGFDWSFDGKQLVFSRGIDSRDVIVIEDARKSRAGM